MRLFRWLLAGPRFRSFDDCYAKTRQGMLDGLVTAINEPTFHRDLLLIVSHFPSTFVEVQSTLDDSGIDYRIGDSRITNESIGNWIESDQHAIVLCLSDALETEVRRGTLDRDRHVALMATERHPWVPNDESIFQFARQLNYTTYLGYYLSLEDPVILSATSPLVLQLLKNAGIENQMVSSSLMTSRIGAKLKKMNRSVDAPPLSADSPEEWFERNAPEFGQAR